MTNNLAPLRAMLRSASASLLQSVPAIDLIRENFCRGGSSLSLSASVALMNEVDEWCRRTQTNYNKLVTAADVGCTTRHKVRAKGQCISVTVADRLRSAMSQFPSGIPKDRHKRRLASIRKTHALPSVKIAAVNLESRRVNREPCSRCGIRADIGCRHSVIWSAGAVAGRASA